MTGLGIMIAILAVITIVIIIAIGVSTKSTAFTSIAAIICIGMSALMVWWGWSMEYKNEHWATCTITGKDRGGDDGSYRIYTEECGQLANTDLWLRGKFNSADIWQEIPDEGVVDLKVVGVRIPFFSVFPDVLEVGEVQTTS